MANAVSAGTIYADTNGLLFTGRVKVAYILISVHTASAHFDLYDGTANTDPQKLALCAPTAHTTQVLDFSRNPLVFQKGIFLEGLAAGDSISIVTTTAGSNN